MRKSFKRFSTTALTAVFASSTFLPVVVDAKENQAEVIGFGIEKNGKILFVSKVDFNEALAELGKVEEAGVFQTTKGEFYSKKDFNEALAEAGTIAKAIELLESDEISLALQGKPVKSRIDDNGKFVPIEDTTKENETKRYLAS